MSPSTDGKSPIFTDASKLPSGHTSHDESVIPFYHPVTSSIGFSYKTTLYSSATYFKLNFEYLWSKKLKLLFCGTALR